MANINITIPSDLSDQVILATLQEMRESIIKDIRACDPVKPHEYANIRDYCNTLNATEVLIKYFGGRYD